MAHGCECDWREDWEMERVFEADILLPVQVERRALSAETRLLIAILRDAIEVYRKYRDARGPLQRNLANDVRVWMHGTEGAVPFEALCAWLGLEPSAVRRAVLGT